MEEADKQSLPPLQLSNVKLRFLEATKLQLLSESGTHHPHQSIQNLPS